MLSPSPSSPQSPPSSARPEPSRNAPPARRDLPNLRAAAAADSRPPQPTLLLRRTLLLLLLFLLVSPPPLPVAARPEPAPGNKMSIPGRPAKDTGDTDHARPIVLNSPDGGSTVAPPIMLDSPGDSQGTVAAPIMLNSAGGGGGGSTVASPIMLNSPGGSSHGTVPSPIMLDSPRSNVATAGGSSGPASPMGSGNGGRSRSASVDDGPGLVVVSPTSGKPVLNEPESDRYLYRALTMKDRENLEAGRPITSTSAGGAPTDPKYICQASTKGCPNGGAPACKACHVAGSSQAKSNWISTSKSVQTSMGYNLAQNELGQGGGVVKIDRNKLPPGTIADLTTPDGRREHLGERPTPAAMAVAKGTPAHQHLRIVDTAHDYSASDKEVLVHKEIPADACEPLSLARRGGGGLSRRAVKGSAECKRNSAKRVAGNVKALFANKMMNADGTLDVKATLAAAKANKRTSSAVGSVTKSTVAAAKGSGDGAHATKLKAVKAGKAAKGAKSSGGGKARPTRAARGSTAKSLVRGATRSSARKPRTSPLKAAANSSSVVRGGGGGARGAKPSRPASKKTTPPPPKKQTSGSNNNKKTPQRAAAVAVAKKKKSPAAVKKQTPALKAKTVTSPAAVKAKTVAPAAKAKTASPAAVKAKTLPPAAAAGVKPNIRAGETKKGKGKALGRNERGVGGW
ncbi:hypothetical protein DFJ73DRAFT_923041 [Zopfochytrium polystomum]|nr:hypothetical protein DFJ73DRAFT_923041 [Zopfochytrium polystomum]